LSGEDGIPIDESMASLHEVARRSQSISIENGETAEFTLEKIREQVASLLTDHSELVVDSSLLRKEKSQYSQSELEKMRRERNRIHAKKTRLRKKKMIQEMETVIIFFLLISLYYSNHYSSHLLDNIKVRERYFNIKERKGLER